MRNVFWTSGWDSTFRVLYLVINKQETVQPFYLLDRDRPSTPIELQTIQAIRDQLTIQFPEALDRLKPLITFNAHEVDEDQTITDANMTMRAEQELGSQYHWIARFVKQQEMGRFEVSFDRDGRGRQMLMEYLEGEGDTLHVASKYQGTNEHKLFQFFDFPLATFERTKSEMGEHARANGYLNILELAWFCHFPVGNEACGGCSPCRHTIQDGMGYRLPWRARYVRYPKRVMERWFKRNLSPEMVAGVRRVTQKFGI